MPHRDSGVTELLHRASDDLTPDVDRLVSGGIARGRTRQRRARIGTTVASLAVIGVVGGLAVVVPRLDGPDSARDLGIATDGSSATRRTVSRSRSFVATSRPFIASGRLSVMVATASTTSSRTGAAGGVGEGAGVVMGAVCPTACGRPYALWCRSRAS